MWERACMLEDELRGKNAEAGGNSQLVQQWENMGEVSGYMTMRPVKSPHRFAPRAFLSYCG